jgi:hypothetical protein
MFGAVTAASSMFANLISVLPHKLFSTLFGSEFSVYSASVRDHSLFNSSILDGSQYTAITSMDAS